MGLPNATSIQQEMDALYGPFKSAATYARGEKVVQAKLKQQRGLARKNGERLQCLLLNLDFSNLPTIVNGTSDDNELARPSFQCTFQKGKDTSVMEESRVYTIYKKLFNKRTGEKGIGTGESTMKT